MATEAQVQANRANAQKSTGPRTPEGKEKAAQNSLEHGLFARQTVIRGEDEVEFERHRHMLRGQLIADSPLEEMLANRIVDLSWRLRRAVQDQEEAFVTLYEKYVAPEAAAEAQEPPEPAERAGLIGRLIVEDFGQEGVLDRLLRYERRIEGSLYRTLNQLRRVHDQVQRAFQEDSSVLDRWREEDWEAKKARLFRSCPPPEDEMCKTNPILAEVSGLKGQVPSETCKTKPISSTAARSEDEMRKTNPISNEVSGLEPQVSRKSCETKPIWEGVSNFK